MISFLSEAMTQEAETRKFCIDNDFEQIKLNKIPLPKVPLRCQAIVKYVSG